MALAGYYYAHKPVSPGNAEALARVVADSCLALLIVFVGGAIGRRLIPQAHSQPLAALSFQAALGLGLMGLGFYCWGQSGSASVVVLRPPRGADHRVAAVGLGLGAAGRAGARCIPPRLLALARRGAGRSDAGHAGLVRSGRAACPIRCVALPPRSAGALPGSGIDQVDTGHQLWGMPLLGEMLYTLAMGLGRAQTAALLGWAAAVLTLLGVAGLGTGWGRRGRLDCSAGPARGSTLASSPGWAYVDWWQRCSDWGC